jgi:hypothetical protein
VVTDLWDGVTFAGCLVHLCSHDAFKENWSGIGALFTTNPLTTLKTIWDESTKNVRDDWNNGHQVRAVFRAVPTVLGAVFGGKGLTKLKNLKDLKGLKNSKRGGNGTPDPPKTADEAAQRAEQAARTGDVPEAKKSLKDARSRLKEAEKEARKNPTQANKDSVKAAREAVDRAKNAVVDAGFRRILMQTPEGRWANDVINRNNVKVTYTKKGGSYFMPNDNRIVISFETGRTPEHHAMVLVHEATHADFQHLGTKVNPWTPYVTKKVYVDSMLAEEAEAVFREVKFARELRAQGVKVPDRGNLDGVYDKAYKNAVDAAEDNARKTGRPPLSDMEKRHIGEQAASQAIEREFKAGRVSTSTTGEPYTDYYGNAWDQFHGQHP